MKCCCCQLYWAACIQTSILILKGYSNVVDWLYMKKLLLPHLTLFALQNDVLIMGKRKERCVSQGIFWTNHVTYISVRPKNISEKHRTSLRFFIIIKSLLLFKIIMTLNNTDFKYAFCIKTNIIHINILIIYSNNVAIRKQNFSDCKLKQILAKLWGA